MPGFTVKVIRIGQKNAEPLDQSHHVAKFVFEDLEKAADKLTLDVENWDLSNFDDPIWADGNELVVSWGYDGNMAPERRMVIKNVKGSTMLQVEALAKSVLMNQDRKTRVFEDVKYSNVATQIAKENGYSDGLQQHIDDSEVTHEVVSQAGLSDAQLLRHLANKLHWEWYVDFDGFHFHPRRLGQRPIKEYTYFLDPDLGDILKFNIENDLTAKPQSPQGAVNVKGRDPKNKKDIDVNADKSSEAGRDTLADVQKVVDPASGAKTYQQANAVAAVVNSSAASAAQAKAEAKGSFLSSQTRTVKLVGTWRGDPNIVAKSIIGITFPGAKSISGNYYVVSVKHSLGADMAPYTMEIHARRDGTTSTGKAGEIKTGGKTNNQDPAAAGELTPEKKVDPASGVRTTVYTDKKGRK